MTAAILDTGMSVPMADQIAAVRREINMRARVYPNLVTHRKMSQHKADVETAAVQAVLETLLRAEREGWQ